MSRFGECPDWPGVWRRVTVALLRPHFGIAVAMALLWLSAATDLVFTAWGLRLGIIEEANPLLAHFFSISKPLTVIGGLFCITGALALLWYYRERLYWIYPVTRVLLAVRVLVLGMHIYWILQI